MEARWGVAGPLSMLKQDQGVALEITRPAIFHRGQKGRDARVGRWRR
jgi:hypothetical protein